MHRLFVAIDFPDEIRGQLGGLCLGLPGARWVSEDQLHLTLRFIGEVDGDVFRSIKEALRAVTAPPFSITLRGLGCFPPRGRPRVLWVGVGRSEQLVQLRNRVEAALTRVGLEAEGRKFSPHITLARFREDLHLTRLGNYLAGNNLFSTPPVEIGAFALYSSFLTGKGAIHQLEATYPLRPPR